MRRHQISVKEQEGSRWHSHIDHIEELLARLSNCHIHELTVCAYELNKFGRIQFDDDIANYWHVDFRVKHLIVDGTSRAANFDTLYIFLMQPWHVPENAKV